MNIVLSNNVYISCIDRKNTKAKRISKSLECQNVAVFPVDYQFQSILNTKC